MFQQITFEKKTRRSKLGFLRYRTHVKTIVLNSYCRLLHLKYSFRLYTINIKKILHEKYQYIKFENLLNEPNFGTPTDFATSSVYTTILFSNKSMAWVSAIYGQHVPKILRTGRTHSVFQIEWAKSCSNQVHRLWKTNSPLMFHNVGNWSLS